MTSLRRRLDNVLTQLAIIRQALNMSSDYPPCCLISKEGMLSCDFLGPLPEEEFLKQCQKCQAEIKKVLICLNSLKIEKI